MVRRGHFHEKLFQLCKLWLFITYSGCVPHQSKRRMEVLHNDQQAPDLTFHVSIVVVPWIVVGKGSSLASTPC